MASLLSYKNLNRVAIDVLGLSIVFVFVEPFLHGGFFDECLLAVLLVCMIELSRTRGVYKEVKIYAVITLCYLAYSLLVHQNVAQANVRDFLIFQKPFISFYLCYMLGFNPTQKQKQIYKCLFFLFGIFLCILSRYVNVIYSNTTHYYSACILVAVGYLIFTDMNMKNFCIATLFILPGIASNRAKFYAELVAWLVIVFGVKGYIKLRLKYIFLFALGICAIVYMTREKLTYYFVDGFEDGYARSVMYATSLNIFRDYFPLGPGYGTFGSDSALKYYSPLNYEYGLNTVYGLGEFVRDTSNNYYNDTFYPILSQFGVVGLLLFIWFIARIWFAGRSIVDFSRYRILVFLLSYMLIQCVAENSFTGSKSIPVMMMIGYMLSVSDSAHRQVGKNIENKYI